MNSGRRKVILFLAVLFLSCVILSCRTADIGLRTMGLNGMVYDFSNRPIAHCEIFIGNRYRGSTDINGRFTLPNVKAGNHTITGIKKGFEEFSDTVTIKDSREIVYFRMPSQNQLLDLLDEALSSNDFSSAESIAERAYKIDPGNIEMLFYYATVKFRQNEHGKAIEFLLAAKKLGSKDVYVDRFLAILRKVHNADTKE